MAYAAEIDANGIVINVIVIPDDLGGLSVEEYCAPHGAEGSMWKQTYEGARYAGKGHSYSVALGEFIRPRPIDIDGRPAMSWQIDPVTKDWAPPKGREKPAGNYLWSELLQQWVFVSKSEQDTIR